MKPSRAEQNRRIAGTLVLVILAAFWLTYCSVMFWPAPNPHF